MPLRIERAMKLTLYLFFQNVPQLEIYQWIVPLIALYYLFRIIRQIRIGKKTIQNALVWIVFWLFIILLAVLPNGLTNKIAYFLGFKDNVNALIFSCLGLLFIMVYQLSSGISNLDRKLTKLVREIALKDDDGSEQTRKP